MYDTSRLFKIGFTPFHCRGCMSFKYKRILIILSIFDIKVLVACNHLQWCSDLPPTFLHPGSFCLAHVAIAGHVIKPRMETKSRQNETK